MYKILNSDRFTYQTIEGTLKPALIRQLLILYDVLFEDAKLDFFVDRIHSKENTILNLCYEDSKLIG